MIDEEAWWWDQPILPGGLVVKSLHSHCRGHGFDHGEGWGVWWRVEKKCGYEDARLVARGLLVVVVLFSKVERSWVWEELEDIRGAG